MIQVKRIYAPAKRDDGYRILVDRVWPRGIAKREARVDRWAREIAPSAELRRWFNHDPAKWPEFRKRYRRELKTNAALPQLRSELKGHKRVTLLFGARDQEHNNAVALSEILGAST